MWHTNLLTNSTTVQRARAKRHLPIRGRTSAGWAAQGGQLVLRVRNLYPISTGPKVSGPLHHVFGCHLALYPALAGDHEIGQCAKTGTFPLVTWASCRIISASDIQVMLVSKRESVKYWTITNFA